ncbi:TorD/DmsD family molecular chaperone [Saccharolobus caldissimus]|uniref:Component of anaerobic dehydrogenase n=1 Tax=Saccharolobus caldissimus TaxID=1702097 RepID=A0AAQ4CU46_9CREN|nr:molecular chaperone TorD family protein [Saccharolobus caldissimus]BDB99327.1 component of anaerobic dehydrogenase [Saccharolobus caldissimus]
MSLSLMDLTLLRFYIYDLFSEIFLYKIEDNEYNQMIEKINKIDENFREILKQLSNVDTLEIRKKFESIEKKDYLIEYSTLFLAGFGNKPLTPVESKQIFVNLGEKIALFKYSDIVKFYRLRGIVTKLDRNFVHEIDHISTILAFMSFLVKEEYELRKLNKNPFKTISDEINFMTTHIMGWVPSWANNVINDSRSDIFRIVCKNLLQWINYDYNNLSRNLPKI